MIATNYRTDKVHCNHPIDKVPAGMSSIISLDDKAPSPKFLHSIKKKDNEMLLVSKWIDKEGRFKVVQVIC